MLGSSPTSNQPTPQSTKVTPVLSTPITNQPTTNKVRFEKEMMMMRWR